MTIRTDIAREIKAGRTRWLALDLYGKFEHAVVLVLGGLIALIALSALWNLAVLMVTTLILVDPFDPTEHTVFQELFGMIFTVIIALEFKHSVEVSVGRQESVVQVRSVVLLTMLAVLRKIIIFDMSASDAAWKLMALGVAMLALGAVYWFVRERGRHEGPGAGRAAASPSGHGAAATPDRQPPGLA